MFTLLLLFEHRDLVCGLLRLNLLLLLWIHVSKVHSHVFNLNRSRPEAALKFPFLEVKRLFGMAIAR